MREKECDALLITNPRDIRFLSGFRGEDSFALLSARTLTIISDFRFAEELEEINAPGVRVHIRRGDIANAVALIADRTGASRIGVQSEHLSVAARKTIARAVGGKRLRDTTGLLATARLRKDEIEVRQLRKAVRIQEEALEATLEAIEPGQTELEVCALLEYEMKIRGAEDPAFDPIVAAKANGSRPHATPGGTRLARNKPLLIDWGARLEGYNSDMTRTFCLGTWPARLRKIYEIVLEAHLAGIEAVKPGARCRDVDAAARKVIVDAGYGPEFGHSLGHGIGLDVHEGPRLASVSTDILEPGMVVTIEPGIYIAGFGGVRIEDDILVTERGRRNLCSLPKDIGWATR